MSKTGRCRLIGDAARNERSSSGFGLPGIDGLNASIVKLARVPGYDSETARGRRRQEGVRNVIIKRLPSPALPSHDPCACLCIGQCGETKVMANSGVMPEVTGYGRTKTDES